MAEAAAAAAAAEPAPADANLIYQFKITLKGIRPPIWRRIQVPATYTFYDLHCAIFQSMGWFDTHLHQFNMNGVCIGTHDELRDGLSPSFYDGLPEVVDENVTKISQFFVAPKSKARYEYDFGDGWDHDVLLEKILPAVPGVKYPKCITGRRACPPENCGGVGGYQELISIMADPNHPERADQIENLGYNGIEEEDFKPNEFDIESVHFSDAKAHREHRGFCMGF